MFEIKKLCVVVLALLAGACGDDAGPGGHTDEGDDAADRLADSGDGDAPAGDGDVESHPDDPVAETVATYSRIVLASYEDSLDAAVAMDLAIDAFLANPTEDTLDAAKQAWLDAREPYLQTEVYRFYEGPIDNEEDGPEGLLNAWPLDEHFIDYVDGDDSAGIINDPEQTIDAESLEGLNEHGGEKNIATGFHAIEFLLWGQDGDDAGPGARPATDFVDGGSADNQERRRQYLEVVSDLLITHLQQLVDAWAEDENNYRAELEALEPAQALERILTGMIVLSGFETGGERLQTALDTADQEDEHSCFSDNTHRDMVQDVRGIQNVYLGSYERIDGSTVSGTGVIDVVAALDEDLAEKVEARIAESLSLAEELVPPFDQEIALDNAQGRTRVEALVESLLLQEEDLFDIFSAFGLSVEIPEA
ncbi:MAG: iron-regulated protein [Myxococcales bacterium]|nr:iron-regulated protein [Myxococcales bacterium]